jgi:hypothetical protein
MLGAEDPVAVSCEMTSVRVCKTTGSGEAPIKHPDDLQDLAARS